MEANTCSTCKYHRTMPIWTSGIHLEIRDYCCRDEFVKVNPDDTCEHWDTAFDNVAGTSFNKN